jgi:hypothetical protein
MLPGRLDSDYPSPYLSRMPCKPAKVPAFIPPQIPVLSAEPATEAGWIHGLKHDKSCQFDGERAGIRAVQLGCL